jgi:hypothetical protein
VAISTTLEICVERKKLDVAAPKLLKKPFIHILIKNKQMKKVKNLPAVKVNPIIK